MLEFYNVNHSKASGQFSSGSGGAHAALTKATGVPVKVTIIDNPGRDTARINALALIGKERDPRFASHPGERMGDLDMGSIQWHKKTGVIEMVGTQAPYGRKGVATAMLKEARRYAAKMGYAPVIHSTVLTPEGSAWSKVALGSHVLEFFNRREERQ